MSVLGRAKWYYNKFNLENGWDESHIIRIMGERFTDEKLDFFKRFYSCLLGKKFCNKMTEEYIRAEDLSMRETIVVYNMRHPDEKINENTALSQMNYCAGKLKAIFTDEKILDNIYKSTEPISTVYLKQLNKFIIQYGSKCDNKKDFNINIPALKRSGEVTDESFVSFLRLLEPYTKNYMREVQSEINSRVDEVGYFNYIMKPDIELTPTEQKHKELVEIILGKREGKLPTFEIEEEPERDFSKFDLVKSEQVVEVDETVEPKDQKEIFTPDFSDNDEDTISLSKEQSESTTTIPQTRMSKEEGYKVDEYGLGTKHVKF